MEVAGVAKLRYWRKEQARVVVDAWRRAREPLAQFGRRHGIDPRRIARWSAKLKRGALSAIRFHAVRLARAAEVGSIEIAFGDGWRVRVARGFDADDLRRLLAVLGERATC
jgi:hypothetical protein